MRLAAEQPAAGRRRDRHPHARLAPARMPAARSPTEAPGTPVVMLTRLCRCRRAVRRIDAGASRLRPETHRLTSLVAAVRRSPPASRCSTPPSPHPSSRPPREPPSDEEPARSPICTEQERRVSPSSRAEPRTARSRRGHRRSPRRRSASTSRTSWPSCAGQPRPGRRTLSATALTDAQPCMLPLAPAGGWSRQPRPSSPTPSFAGCWAPSAPPSASADRHAVRLGGLDRPDSGSPVPHQSPRGADASRTTA